MFAINRTGGVDEQQIGWRATVSTLNEDTGAWRVVRRSAMTRAMATDQLASYFNGQGWLAGFPLSRETYSSPSRWSGMTRTIRAGSKVARPTRSSIS